MEGEVSGTFKGEAAPVRVVDGDTVLVRRKGSRRKGRWRSLFGSPSIRVRLYGVNAPETNQRFGRKSTRSLRRMLAGGGFEMEAMGSDRYGRVLGLIHRGSRYQSVNLAMVSEGWAHAYVRFGGRGLGMEEAERTVRENGLGIWERRRAAEHPELWRKRQRMRMAQRRKFKRRCALYCWQRPFVRYCTAGLSSSEIREPIDLQRT